MGTLASTSESPLETVTIVSILQKGCDGTPRARALFGPFLVGVLQRYGTRP